MHTLLFFCLPSSEITISCRLQVKSISSRCADMNREVGLNAFYIRNWFMK